MKHTPTDITKDANIQKITTLNQKRSLIYNKNAINNTTAKQ